MMRVIKDESGSVMVLMLAFTFVVSYLLLAMARQVETQANSFDRTRLYLQLNVLESEGLAKIESFLETKDAPVDIDETWQLRDLASIAVRGQKMEDYFAIFYKVMYNGNIRVRTILYCLETGEIRFEL